MKCDSWSYFIINIQKFFFFWIGMSVLTVQCSPRGDFLSGQAACFWNNDLDKNPNNSTFDSLTAKSLSLLKRHSTLQLSVSLKQRYRSNWWQFCAAQACQTNWKYDTLSERLLLVLVSVRCCSIPWHWVIHLWFYCCCMFGELSYAC